MIVIWSLVLYWINFSLANQGNLEACFTSSTATQAAYQNIDFLKLDGEEIVSVGNCLDIYASERRIQFYYKFLTKKYVNRVRLRHFTGTLDAEGKTCHIRVERIKLQSKSQFSAEYSKVSYLDHSEARAQSHTETNLLLTDSAPGKISINGQELNITCSLKSDGAQLDFSLLGTSGDNKSTLFLQKGQRLEVVNVIQNLNDKHRQAKLPVRASTQEKNIASEERVYLSWK